MLHLPEGIDCLQQHEQRWAPIRQIFTLGFRPWHKVESHSCDTMFAYNIFIACFVIMFFFDIHFPTVFDSHVGPSNSQGNRNKLGSGTARFGWFPTPKHHLLDFLWHILLSWHTATAMLITFSWLRPMRAPLVVMRAPDPETPSKSHPKHPKTGVVWVETQMSCAGIAFQPEELSTGWSSNIQDISKHNPTSTCSNQSLRNWLHGYA